MLRNQKGESNVEKNELSLDTLDNSVHVMFLPYFISNKNNLFA